MIFVHNNNNNNNHDFINNKYHYTFINIILYTYDE